MTKAKSMFLVCAIVAVFGLGVVLGAPHQQKSGIPKPSQASESGFLSAGEVAQLLRLIDVDNTGKITKQQWMDFMATEFDRLDTNKSGVLDREELSRSRLRVSSFAKSGK